MGAAKTPLRSASVRIVLNDVVAVAGKHFDPAVSEGWCELFIECFIEPEPFLCIATSFAARHGGRVQPLQKDRWRVPLLRVVLPLPSRGSPMVAFARLSAALFQALLRVADQRG